MAKFNNSGVKGGICSCTVQLACCFLLLSYGTNGWAITANEYQGMWNHCNKTGNFHCCQKLESYISSFGDSIPAWFTAVRCLNSLALFSSAMSLVLITLYTIPETYATEEKFRVMCLIACFVTGKLILVADNIYGSRYRYEEWLNVFFLDYSYAFSIVSGVLFIIGGILVAIFKFAPVHPTNVAQVPVTEPKTRPRTAASIFIADNGKCTFCKQRDKMRNFYNCNHQISCQNCLIQLVRNECPICATDAQEQ